MIYDQFLEIVQGLNEADVRYLIVGGFAVVAHGYQRFTADIDIIFDFDPANLQRAISVFVNQGYKPRAPIDITLFANAELRAQWQTEKDMLVFSVWRNGKMQAEVDWFIEHPFDFAVEYANRAVLPVGDDTLAPFVSLATLMKMKEEAGRAKDIDDIQVLRAIAAGNRPASS